MTKRNRTLAIRAVAILIAGLSLVVFVKPALVEAAEYSSVRGPSAVEPTIAPGFTLHDLKGNAVSLRSLRGKVVFLNVWATWCGPCQEELPSIEKLYEDFKVYPDFVILAVNENTDVSQTPVFVRKNGLQFPVLLDPDNHVGQEYDVFGIPETFIISRQGLVIFRHMGPFDWSRPDFEDDLRKLLREDEKLRSSAGGTERDG